MTKQSIVPSVLEVHSVGVDISNDLQSSQTKSIAQCLHDQENSTSEKETDKDKEE